MPLIIVTVTALEEIQRFIQNKTKTQNYKCFHYHIAFIAFNLRCGWWWLRCDDVEDDGNKVVGMKLAVSYCKYLFCWLRRTLILLFFLLVHSIFYILCLNKKTVCFSLLCCFVPAFTYTFRSWIYYCIYVCWITVFKY